MKLRGRSKSEVNLIRHNSIKSPPCRATILEIQTGVAEIHEYIIEAYSGLSGIISEPMLQKQKIQQDQKIKDITKIRSKLEPLEMQEKQMDLVQFSNLEHLVQNIRRSQCRRQRQLIEQLDEDLWTLILHRELKVIVCLIAKYIDQLTNISMRSLIASEINTFFHLEKQFNETVNEINSKTQEAIAKYKELLSQAGKKFETLATQANATFLKLAISEMEKLEPQISKAGQPLVVQTILAENDRWLNILSRGTEASDGRDLSEEVKTRVQRFDMALDLLGEEFLDTYFEERHMTKFQHNINRMYRRLSMVALHGMPMTSSTMSVCSSPPQSPGSFQYKTGDSQAEVIPMATRRRAIEDAVDIPLDLPPIPETPLETPMSEMGMLEAFESHGYTWGSSESKPASQNQSLTEVTEPDSAQQTPLQEIKPLKVIVGHDENSLDEISETSSYREKMKQDVKRPAVMSKLSTVI